MGYSVAETRLLKTRTICQANRSQKQQSAEEKVSCVSHFGFLICFSAEEIELIEMPGRELFSQTDVDMKIMKEYIKATSLLQDHRGEQNVHQWSLASFGKMLSGTQSTDGDSLQNLCPLKK